MSASTLTYSSQIKLTLPMQLQDLIQSKASKFGLSISAYVKHLIIDDVKDLDLPTFKMSQKTEKVMTDAIQEHRQGKTKQIIDIDQFIQAL